MATSKLVEACKRIERNIYESTDGGAGSHRRRLALLRDLAHWIMACRVSDEFDRLLKLRLPWKQWDMELIEPGLRLAQALRCMDVERLSQERALKWSGAKRSELTYALGLLKRAQLTKHDIVRAQAQGVEHDLIDNVEDLHVRFETRALEDILLSAAEGYVPLKRSPYTEVFGLCFGTTRSYPTKQVARRTEINVVRVVTQMRAVSSIRTVEPNWDSAAAHVEIAEKFFPHLEVVGDYHTHPHPTLASLEANRGWTYSDQDERSIQVIAEKLHYSNNPLRFGLIVAMARGGRAGHLASRLGRHVVKLSVADLFFVIAAYRIRRNLCYDECVTLHLATALPEARMRRRRA